MRKKRCCIKEDSIVFVNEILKAANKVKTNGNK